MYNQNEARTLAKLRFGPVPADRVARVAFIHALPEDFRKKYNYFQTVWPGMTTKQLVEEELLQYVLAGN